MMIGKRMAILLLLVLLFTSLPGRAQLYSVSTIAGGAPPPTPTAALNASIGAPGVSAVDIGVAVDIGGRVFFTSTNCVFRLDLDGTLTRVAGNSRAGYSGDGGAATNAQLNRPYGIAVDEFGNIYIADLPNNRIRKVDSAGTITTFAGTGSPGFSGDGGPASDAQLNGPYGVAVDSEGNVYIADLGNFRIRKVSPAGIITTVAGNGIRGGSDGGGSAVNAQFEWPAALAVSATGELYIADNHVIRKISSGIITRVAGDGTFGGSGPSGDGGPATRAQLAYPTGLAVDRAGNVFIADSVSNRVRKVLPTGIITTVAGDGSTGYFGDGGPASNAHLLFPSGVAVDVAGNLFIGDSGNSRIRKVQAQAPGIIGTVAGNGIPSYSGDGGPAAKAQLNTPTGVAVDDAGNIFIADTLNQRIRKISPAGMITTIAGNGSQGYSGDGGPAINAQLSWPSSVAVDRAGNVFIADLQNYLIRKVSPAGIITSVAGNHVQGYSGDGGIATNAQLNEPGSIAVDSAGNLYIADVGVNRIRMVSPAGIITTVAGGGTSGTSGDGGPAIKAQLDWPTSVAVDSTGALFVAQPYQIRRISPTGVITTIAGDGRQGYSGDGGSALNAEMDFVTGVAVDRAGNLFIADDQNRRIRKVSTDGIITTVASIGIPGYSGDGGAATLARFGSLNIAVDGAANIYVADGWNSAIRFLKPVSPAEAVTSVTSGASNISGAVSPGEIVVLYGSGLGPATLTRATVGNEGTWGTELGGTSLTFNGFAAPIVYTSATQVSAIVPYSISGDSAQIIVTYRGRVLAPVSVPVVSSVPGLFTLDGSGWGQAAAVNQDHSINSATQPSHAGDVISLFATGEGETDPHGIDGKPATAPYPKPTLVVRVTIGEQAAQVLYAGGAPGQVAGVLQINVRIPNGIQPGGDIPVKVQVGDASSQSGVTIAVSK
jgi:uncharacterized protein (TIGR03437 family)